MAEQWSRGRRPLSAFPAMLEAAGTPREGSYSSLPEHQGSFQKATLAFKPYIPLMIVHSCISESYQEEKFLSTAENLYIAQGFRKIICLSQERCQINKQTQYRENWL